MIESRASADFWRCYNGLPPAIRQLADKQFAIFRETPEHPSLQLKRIDELWSVRVSMSYRALAMREGNVFYWFWIGNHDEYERMIR